VVHFMLLSQRSSEETENYHEKSRSGSRYAGPRKYKHQSVP
jgi:hypothetical protein